MLFKYFPTSRSAFDPPKSPTTGTSRFLLSSSFKNEKFSYADLMVADDGNSVERSYLANEENFSFLKELESKNLLVPVVGDFGGSKALREVGKYLKSIDATVSAFYLSNVEQYLIMDGKWDAFCGSAASLPLDDASAFIRSGNGTPYSGNRGGGVQNSWTAGMLSDLKPCAVSVR